MPAPRIKVLKTSLSMHTDEARTSGADVLRDAGELAELLHLVLPERAVEDRQHDVHGAERRGRRVGGDGSVSAVVTASICAAHRPPGAHLPSRPISIVVTSYRAASSAAATDAAASEISCSLDGRQEHGEPDAIAHGIGVVSVVVSVGGGVVTSGGGTYDPIVILTSEVEVGLRVAGQVLGGGDAVERLVVRVLPLPRRGSRRHGASRSRRRRSAGDVGARSPSSAFETESVTDEPFDAVELPGGSCDDSPAGRLDSTVTRPTVNLADWSCWPRPRTSGRRRSGRRPGLGPLETLIRTDEPSTSTVPDRGFCAVTIPDGRS